MKTIIIQIIVCFCFSILSQLYGQNADSLALDPSIRYGKLENGFSYYIKPLYGKIAKTSMGLFMKVGSHQEDPDQYELAHFLEHMPFVKTKHFSHIMSNPQLMEKLNMQSGDISARTGWEKTYYWFNYPSGNLHALEAGLLFFDDIIGGDIKFRKKDIDGERKAFFGEYIYRDSKSSYTKLKYRNKQFNCHLPPIEPKKYKEYVKSFPRKKLIRFYKDWYRPDLAGLVIVGNIDNVEALEEMIIKKFSGMPQEKNPRPLKKCISAYLEQPKQFLSLTRNSDYSSLSPTKAEIKLVFRLGNTDKKTASDFRRKLLEELRMKILNKRLEDIDEKYNHSYAVYAGLDTNLPILSVTINAEEGSEEEAVQFTAGIFKQLKELGVADKEWTELKGDKMRELTQIQTEDAAYWTEQIGNHYVFAEALPKGKNELIIEILESMSAKQFNQYLRGVSWAPDDIAVIKGDKNTQSFSRDTIEEWIEAAASTDDYTEANKEIESLIPANSLEAGPETGFNMEQSDIPGVSELKFENGVKVILKPQEAWSNEEQNNKIRLHGFSEVGAENFPVEDKYNALFAADIIQNSGVKDFDKYEVASFLKSTESKVHARPYINYTESGIKGEANLINFEKMLQLIYLYFTEPRKDTLSFQAWQKDEKEAYEDPSYGLEQADFNHSIAKTLNNNTGRFNGTYRFEASKAVDLEQAYQVYKSIFGNASNFTFILTGNYKKESLLPLVRKYLGNLPNSNPNEKALVNCEKTSENILPAAPLEKVIESDKYIGNIRIRWDYVLPYESDFCWKEQIKLKFLGLIIANRLFQFRYVKKRGIYFATAGNVHNRDLRRNHLILNIPTSNDDLELVLQDIPAMLEELKHTIDEGIFQDVGNGYIYPKYKKERLESSAQMLRRLYHHYRYDEPWVEAHEIKNYVHSLKPKDISLAARKYLKEENRFLFLLEGKYLDAQ